MALPAGTRLGPYEILTPLGAGGMGEVYKARDTRLDRTVAIKVLHAAANDDSGRRARLEREAKTIAALNHPHICTLHDVGEHGGSMFIVMEHLAGETLAARLRKGPLPPEQAIVVGTEIADALAAAHRQGVIHRDLKPGNVMLTKAGAKLLDFGLAKQETPAVGSSSLAMTAVPTQDPQTAPGVVLGTLPYMAPEQLEGREADARSDIFAFGAVLYEMVTGKRAFPGESHASVVSAIMSLEPPPISTLAPMTPGALDRLVRQCLAKLPDDRPDTAHDVANDLRWMREASGAIAPQGRRPLQWWQSTALLVAGALAMAGAGAAVARWLRPVTPRPVPAHLSIDARPAEEVNAGGVYPAWIATAGGTRTAFAWSPDGQSLVFVGRRAGTQQLYVRQLNDEEARPLANTEGAQVPAVSPDGQWIAFWAGGAIRKSPLAGGPVVTVASGLVYPPCGIAWDAGGRLLYGTYNGPIWAVAAEGPPSRVTTVGQAEVGHVLPSVLPDGHTLLYTARKRGWSWGGDEVVAHDLATGARKVLAKEADDARYLQSGHLVFLREGQLLAAPFHAERIEVLGTPVPVLADVAQAFFEGATDPDITGAGQFAISATGTLAWLPGAPAPPPEGSLATVDRQGHVTVLAAPVRSYQGPVRLSPDGRRIALTIWTGRTHGQDHPTGSDNAVLVYDLDRGTLTTVAAGGESAWPVWWPDGQHLVFDWRSDGNASLAVRRADGMDSLRALVPGRYIPASFTPDGRHLIAVRDESDIVSVTIERGQAVDVQPVAATESDEYWPALSPDGRWLAFASNVSGGFEVYVRPYPGPGVVEMVSTAGGGSPVWRGDGRELFFQSRRSPSDGRQQVLSVDFTPAAGPLDKPRIGRPRVLFEFDTRTLALGCGQVRCYDVAPDGQRFYGVQSRIPPTPAVMHIRLILNWFEELNAKVPVPQ